MFVPAQRRRGACDAIDDFVEVQVHADDAGRRDEDLFGLHPRSPAVNSAVDCATSSPASPVHAFAHPLLQTIALARPPDFAEVCARQGDRRGYRLVRREHRRRGTGRSAVITITSSGQA